MLKTEDFASKILLNHSKIEGGMCYMCKRKVTLDAIREIGDTNLAMYQCSSCGALYDKTKFNKLIEFNKAYADIPITGNEYFEHIKQKKRIHDLLVSTEGFKNVEYERKVHCKNSFTGLLNKYPYFIDVYAEYRPKDDYHLIPIGIEIHGEGDGSGHGTPIQIPKDANRKEEIETQMGIKVVEFYINRIKDAPDCIILDEIFSHVGV